MNGFQYLDQDARRQAEQDCFHPWTLAELVTDRHAISRVPTVLLRQLYAQSQVAVGIDTTDTARETLQAVRSDIARTLEVRRRLDLVAEHSPKTPADPRNDDQPVQAPGQPTDAERIAAALKALILLSMNGTGHQDQDQDDDQDGGARYAARSHRHAPRRQLGRSSSFTRSTRSTDHAHPIPPVSNALLLSSAIAGVRPSVVTHPAASTAENLPDRTR